MNNYRSYTDSDIIFHAAEVKSLSGLLKALGLKVAGGNYDNMRRNLQRLGVDTSHWTGQAWNKDKQLKDWSDYTRARQVKKNLFNIKDQKCEVCGLSEWRGQKITLELHHIDGDRTNNTLENFQILCPNCHSITDNYRNKGNGEVQRYCIDCNIEISKTAKRCCGCAGIYRESKKGRIPLCPVKNYCKVCNVEISRRATRCEICCKQNQERIIWPSTEELKKMVEESSYLAVAKKLGVSDNSVRKRIQRHG